MFNFTSQERQVILFLASIFLLGAAISFALKVDPRIEKVFKVDSRITQLDINKASYEDLLDAGVVSPGLAKKIIEYRTSCGNFSSLEELKEIKGIGQYRFEKLEKIFFLP